MARRVFRLLLVLSLVLPCTASVAVQAGQQLIAPQNDAAKPTDDAPAPPNATEADRARAARRLRSSADAEQRQAMQRLLPKNERPTIAGVVHLNGLLCLARQEHGHDEVFILTGGRRTPARGEFRLDDEGSERSIHNQDLFEQTLAPGQETSASVEVWESDGGGKRDDLIGSVRVTLGNIDGQVRASWQPAEFARALAPISPAAERFELTGSGARYQIELTAFTAKPAPLARPTPTHKVVEGVVVPPPPPTRVVIPAPRPPLIVLPYRWYAPRRFRHRW